MSKLLKSKIAVASLLFASAVVCADTSLTFSPLESTVELGEQFSVDIVIKDTTNLNNYNLSVGYNANCISPVSITEKTFLSDVGTTTFSKGSIVTNDTKGEIRNVISSLTDKKLNAAGEGALFSIQFKTIGVCTLKESYLTTFKQSILGVNGDEPGVDYHDGFVAVTTPSTPPPPPTPTYSCITTGGSTTSSVFVPDPDCGPLAGGLLEITSTALQNSDVYVWGFRGSSQQGNDVYYVRSNSAPEKVNSLSNVASLTSGFYHLLALDTNGDVWGWGQNVYGEAGCSKIFASTPCKVLSDVTQIAAGAISSIALDADGKVWTWGHNLFGQLGNGGYRHSRVPVAVDLNGEIARLIGGSYDGAFAVTNEGHVWAWGNNEASGLGIQGTEFGILSIVRNPIRIPNLEVYAKEIMQISGGNGWGEALLTDGRVIGWGLHKSIGQGVETFKTTSPEPVQVMDNVKELFARNNGSIALTSNNEIYTWGMHTRLAPMLYGDKPTLRTNTNGNPISIGGGKNHLFYKNEYGETYGVGYNDFYKLDQSKPFQFIDWPGSKINLQ